jgi:hypothetical protein
MLNTHNTPPFSVRTTTPPVVLMHSIMEHRWHRPGSGSRGRRTGPGRAPVPASSAMTYGRSLARPTRGGLVCADLVWVDDLPRARALWGCAPTSENSRYAKFALKAPAKSSRYSGESAVRANRGAAPRDPYRGARCTAHSALAACRRPLRWRTAGVDITSQPSARGPRAQLRIIALPFEAAGSPLAKYTPRSRPDRDHRGRSIMWFS